MPGLDNVYVFLAVCLWVPLGLFFADVVAQRLARRDRIRQARNRDHRTVPDLIAAVRRRFFVRVK